jgi:hypothetical protein
MTTSATVEEERRELLLRLLRRPVVAVRVPHVQRVRHQRLECVLQCSDAVDRQRAHRRAVVRGPATDHLPAALAAELVVLPRELPGRLDRLGAPRDEEDAVQIARREARDLVRELDRARMGVRPVGVERQLLHLLVRRPADLVAV